MSASLVGSEMCIRDSPPFHCNGRVRCHRPGPLVNYNTNCLRATPRGYNCRCNPRVSGASGAN
eukprot:13991684-Alexandrium_andersonii.AAC.1